jgi:hypothetical protein
MLPPIVLAFRTKYLVSLTTILPAVVVRRFESICKHGTGQFLEDDDARSQKSGATGQTVGPSAGENLFAPVKAGERRVITSSPFYQPELAIFLLLMHGYRGTSRQRLAMQAKSVKKLDNATAMTPIDQRYAPVWYNDYESRFEKWKSLMSMNSGYGIALPDASLIWEYFRWVCWGATMNFQFCRIFPP